MKPHLTADIVFHPEKRRWYAQVFHTRTGYVKDRIFSVKHSPQSYFENAGMASDAARHKGVAQNKITVFSSTTKEQFQDVVVSHDDESEIT